MHYITKKENDKKLCVNCKYFEQLEGPYGLKGPKLCALKRSKVDDSPALWAPLTRYNIFECGGRKYTLAEELAVAPDQKTADRLNEEFQIEQWRAAAIDEIDNPPQGNFRLTCGYLEKAIKRVRAERVGKKISSQNCIDLNAAQKD